jgi:chromosome segregation ATPase
MRRSGAATATASHLSETAQEHLAALRHELESRLAALELVLADPSRGDSLADLILDLARVATEEADAAVAQICLTTKLEADNEIAELRTSAKAALDAAQGGLKVANASLEQERAKSEDLRQRLERAELEIHKQNELLTAREQFETTLQAARDELESQLRRHESAQAELEQRVTELQQQLERERAAGSAVSADMGTQLAREREVAARTGRELADAKAHLQSERDAVTQNARALKEATVQLQNEREGAARQAGALKDLQHELAKARETMAALERSARESADRLTALEREREEWRNANEVFARDLAKEREASATHQRAYADLKTQFEGARAEADDLRSAADRAKAHIATLGEEGAKEQATREQVAAERDRAREEAAAHQKALAQAQQSLAEAQATLEAERAHSSDLRRAVEEAEQQLSGARAGGTQSVADYEKVQADRERERGEAMRAIQALVAQRDALTAELDEARSWIEEHRLAEAEFGSSIPDESSEPDDAVSASQLLSLPAAAPSFEVEAALSSDEVEAAEDGWQVLRLASRHAFREPLGIQINGDAGKLVDLSITGCQVTFPSALKPNQIVKVQIPSTPQISCAGKVVWTRLEPPADGGLMGYRAGISFTKADATAIEHFLAQHGA